MKAFKTITLISTSLTLILFSGCWSRHELNDIAIITAAGIDPGPEDEITFVYQIVNPSAIAGKGVSSFKSPFITLGTTGKTLYSASKKASKEVSRTPYFGHLSTFIINSDVAREKGIKNYLDVLYRDHDLRENTYLLISKDQTAQLILSTQTTMENINGIAIKNHIDHTYEIIGNVRPVELREAVNTLMSESSSLVIPTIKVSPNVQKSKLETTQNAQQEALIMVEGYAIFKKDKLIGFLDTRGARALNFITDDIEKTQVIIPFKGEKHSVEITNSNTKITTDVKNGRPEVLIDVRNEAILSEINVPIDVSKLSVIREFEKSTNQILKKEIEMLIKQVQKNYKVDIFNFGEKFSKQNPKEWEWLKDDWENYLEDLKVEIKVNTIILNIGMKSKTFQIESDEVKK